MDYILGDHVGRCGLCAKKYRDRSSRPVAVLDVQIAVNGPQKVELLSLVLVQALDLYVIYGLGIHHVTLILLKPCGKFVLLCIFPVQDALQECRILCIGKELLKLLCVCLPLLADLLGDQFGQLRIALHDPSAESDAIGLVVELLGIELVEIVELGILEDLRVESGDAVDGMAVVNVHVRHVDIAVLVNDLNGRILIFGLNGLVHPLDDGHQVRNDSLKEVLGPRFQRLCEDRMVRVGADIRHDLIGFLLFNALLDQKAHQLRNDQGRMCIIDLDRSVVGQVVKIAAALDALVEDQLGGVADHEVLLIDARSPQLIFIHKERILKAFLHFKKTRKRLY